MDQGEGRKAAQISAEVSRVSIYLSIHPPPQLNEEGRNLAAAASVVKFQATAELTLQHLEMNSRLLNRYIRTGV
jgi:hypothetical protein